MDGREAMAISGGSAQYFMAKVGLGSASGLQPGGINAPTPFRALTSTHHHNVQAAAAPAASQSSMGATLAGQAFEVELPSPPPSHCGFSRGSISIGAFSAGPPSVEQSLKRKRGRPRKYGPDGKVALGLLPTSGAAPDSSTPGTVTPLPKNVRGRPRGSGRKQLLETVGEWMNSSAGLAFAPHVISFETGEDVVAKILSFSQQRPRAVCILSGCGTISLVTFRQPASSGGSITYEGRFEILRLSGSYLIDKEGGPRNRTGGVSVSLSSPEGHVIGGSAGILIAAGPVQVIICSFVYGNSKAKEKQIVVADPKIEEDSSKFKSGDRSIALSSGPSHNFTSSATRVWPNSQPTIDLKNHHTGIDLTRG
ncbi:hypothetical protein SAY86_013376 [Trapa natans]|uniref:AT-hook motif nuclear-localized protein n=1 Tax=Trapa natans TaxID=22666 RepID=A0AAN7MBL6_TRANT|nr:hypothetical protein SAY86_013376 [Trapa natans]